MRVRILLRIWSHPADAQFRGGSHKAQTILGMSEVGSDDEDVNPCPDCNEGGETCESCLAGMDEVYWRNHEDGISEQFSQDEEDDDDDRDDREDRNDRDDRNDRGDRNDRDDRNGKEISEFEVSDDEDKDERNGFWISSDEDENEDPDPILSRSYPPHVIHHHFHWNMQNTKYKTKKHKKTPKS